MAGKHYRNYEKAKRDRKDAKNKTKSNKTECSDHNGPRPTHQIATNHQITLHAVRRFAERVFDLDSQTLNATELEDIAKTIRSHLPETLVDEAKINLFDNFYAIINKGLVVTIIGRAQAGFKNKDKK